MTPRKKKTKISSQPDENLNNDDVLKQSEILNQENLNSDSSNVSENNINIISEIDNPDPLNIAMFEDSLDTDSLSTTANEALRTETIQPKYHEKPTVPRKAFFTDELNDELFKEIDNIYDTFDQTENANEDFVRDIKASLVNDEFINEEIEDSDKNLSLNKFETGNDGADMVANIEQEIELAPKVENPFSTYNDEISDNDFLSQLNDIFPEDIQDSAITQPLDQYEGIENNDQSLSTESWQDVLESTKDIEKGIQATNLFLKSSDQNNEENPFYSEPWQEEVSLENSADELEINLEDNELNEIKQDESLSTLRRSFIEDFEQSPWSSEEQPPEKEEIGWVKRNWRSFKNWVASLSVAERVLLIISSIISLAVIVAISLVIIEWRSITNMETPPPEVIELIDQNVVYPTGIQLPGGWFFFLQPGEIKNNKWNPQTAEWLQNTSVRRVVAVPWSRQAEAVIQSMQEGDEINIYMNNNDIITYYVKETNQVERDNVNILTDTEPSLAVILFKTDNSNRWVVIARP